MGRGKSTLTDFFKKDSIKGHLTNVIYDRISENQAQKIKEGVEKGFKFIIHIQGKEELKEIPLAIKRRALIFKIDF